MSLSPRIDTIEAKTPNAQVRADSGNGHGSTNTKIRRLVNFVTTGTGITAADSATLGTSFTINENSVYAISYSDRKISGAFDHGISLNTANPTTNIFSLSAAERIIYCEGSSSHIIASATVRLSAGDVIRPHTNGVQDATSSEVQFVITQVCKL